MWVTRKIFTRPAANLFFFNRFSGDILFSSLVSFAFLILALFVWCFSNLKMHILSHIRLCERVSDKHFFIRSISGNKTTFFCGLTKWKIIYAMFKNAKDKNVKVFSAFASSSSIIYNFRYGKEKVKYQTERKLWHKKVGIPISCTIQLKLLFQNIK